MHYDKDDRSFPAIHLADAANINSPTELHRHKLKELAERLDHFHSFHQRTIREVEDRSEKP